MWAYPSDYLPRTKELETPPREPAAAHLPVAIINFPVAVAGIGLELMDQPRGAFIVLIVLAALNGLMLLRR